MIEKSKTHKPTEAQRAATARVREALRRDGAPKAKPHKPQPFACPLCAATIQPTGKRGHPRKWCIDCSGYVKSEKRFRRALAERLKRLEGSEITAERSRLMTLLNQEFNFREFRSDPLTA